VGVEPVGPISPHRFLPLSGRIMPVSRSRLTELARPYRLRFQGVIAIPLSSDSLLWGKDVDDDRYA
jgi:hypothetical protein